MDFASRIGTFLIFILLTIITLGIYPFYWAIVRVEQHIDLLTKIEKNTRAN